jgi:enoyl-CoA hydratase/carnithine racemase
MDGSEEDEFRTWILGPLYQMTSLMLHEKRSHLSQMNAIGELCAQFSRGIVALARADGADGVGRTVSAYHDQHPQAAKNAWYPKAFAAMDGPEWQQLYVNAEHDGEVGVISISRESYNQDVDGELNRAIDWLQAQGIDRVIVTGDFHMSTQMTGADTRDFFPALEQSEQGVEISRSWSRTARRLHTDFATSVGFVNGKRCLGGFLELLLHCHYLLADENAELGFPEVTLPVVPGMEGCHWPFRKMAKEQWPKLFGMLLEGRSVKAGDAVGWLLDFAGPLEQGIQLAWKTASGDGGLRKRELVEGRLEGVEGAAGGVKEAAGPSMVAGRKAILANVRESCGATLVEALEIQARHSGGFMSSKECQRGIIGTLYQKTMQV